MFLTVNVPNVRKEDAAFRLNDDGHVYFKGMGGNLGHEAEYVLDINLLKNIKAEVSYTCFYTKSGVGLFVTCHDMDDFASFAPCTLRVSAC